MTPILVELTQDPIASGGDVLCPLGPGDLRLGRWRHRPLGRLPAVFRPYFHENMGKIQGVHLLNIGLQLKSQVS